MEFQIDTRKQRPQEVRVGQDNQEVAVFRKASFFIHNLAEKFEGIDYQMKLPAPWTGFHYRLRQDKLELAKAKKRGRMHAFESDRPLIRHRLVEFDLGIDDRTYQLAPEDRYGLTYTLREGNQECGNLILRTFEAQQEGAWEADLRVPEDWSVPLAAFVAWLAREGRRGMGHSERL